MNVNNKVIFYTNNIYLRCYPVSCTDRKEKKKKTSDYIENNKIYFVLILCPSFRKAVEHFQI